MHVHTAADPFTAPLWCHVLDITTGGSGIVTDHCADGVPLISWDYTRSAITPIVDHVYAIARQSYREVCNAAPKIAMRRGEYALYLGFHAYIPDELLPYLSNEEGNSNLRVLCATYAELRAFTMKFSAYSFHVYALTGTYSTDLGCHQAGGWTNFGGIDDGLYRFPVYRSEVHYYNWLG